MKKQYHIFFSFILLVSFSWQSAARSAIFINFKLHQEELANTVCENKDKPMSCCEAKCHLEKEIKKENKRQSELPASIKDKAEKSELRTGLLTVIVVPVISIQKAFFIYIRSIPNVFFTSIFHPPSL